MTVARGATVTGELTIDVGVTPLGAYSVSVACDRPDVLEIVNITGGPTAEFAGQPTQTVSGCHADFGAFQAVRLDGPTGTVSVAQIMLKVRDEAPLGAMITLHLTVNSLFDTDANPIPPANIEDTKVTVSCVGDCNGDQSVTVDELATMARIFLGTLKFSDAGCQAGDKNGDSKIEIEELVTAVNNAKCGCPNACATQTPTTTPTTTLGPPTRTPTRTATPSGTPSATRTAATASPTATTALPGPSPTRTPTLTQTTPTATSTVTPTGSTRIAVSAPVSYLNALLGPDNGARAAASLPASYLNALLGQDDRSRAAGSGPVSYLNALPGMPLTDRFQASPVVSYGNQ